MPTNFTSTLALPGPDGGSLTVTADQGTQFVGQMSGPLKLTATGDITVSLVARDGGASAAVRIPSDLHGAVAEMIKAAHLAAESRDEALDQTPTD